MVTLCTTRFNIRIMCACYSLLMHFVWVLEQTMILTLHNINLLVFVTEMEYVYCAVRTEYLNIM